ncbi:S-layer homology domain-containing protein [Bacillus smithii]|uniref:S-layer homology domain-containing protein n=1 Tax=Bacillus smithii TaxID=1479 RepID=UPI002E22CAD8|nr:S-layer homology domain-containing protein [Bacillus smithii]
MKMRRRMLIVVMFLLVFSAAVPPQPSRAASDDISGITLEKEMRELIAKGIISGYGKGVYKPGKKVTRGEFAKFLANALKLDTTDAPNSFKDVSPTSALAPGINAAAKVNIIKGKTGGNFGPDEFVTRQEMAVMIKRAIQYLNVPLETGPTKFTDISNLKDEFKTAIVEIAQADIIHGYQINGKWVFQPDNAATRAEAAAFISRMLDFVEQHNNEPAPVKNPYETAVVSNHQVKPTGNSYKTFNDAKNTVDAGQSDAVTYNGRVVYMKSGIVVPDRATLKSTIKLYSDSDLKNSYTYISPLATYSSEMKYITSTDKYVKVETGGKPLYVSPQDVILEPDGAAPGQNYYQAENGELIHYLYVDTGNGGYYSKLLVGKAPAFLKEGQPYYSWDGYTFYDANHQKVGTAYQYFQFLSARTATNYTAEQLDQAIMTKLAELEKLYQQNPIKYAKYKDATKKSKLIGLGSHLKKVESDKHINALLILGLAFNESDYGLSPIAQTKNNLFGLNAVDSDTNKAYTFSSPEKCVDALADKFNDSYFSVDDYRANGAIPGNKGTGINVRYASDMFWGEKLASHMYRIDQSLGGKDFGNYTIGLTNGYDPKDGLNIRSKPQVSSSTLLFEYNKLGMPVAIVGTSGSWYKIYSDVFKFADQFKDGVYVSGDYVDILPIAGK